MELEGLRKIKTRRLEGNKKFILGITFSFYI